MARPTPLLEDVKGMGRDFAIDELPRGYVWDMIDYIPNRRGAKLEGRGPWSYLSSSGLGPITGGKHAAFSKGAKLLIVGGTNLYNHPLSLGATLQTFSMFPVLHNGIMLRERCYFADAQGLQTPKFATFDGTTLSVAQLAGANAPKAKVIEAFKSEWLLAGGMPTEPETIRFSPLETKGGPPGAWDVNAYKRTLRAITGFAPMTGITLVFHSKSIEKLKGSIPPGTDVDSDMSCDIFSDQLGCEDPASIVNYQENVVFANQRGVHLTDGATIRSLTDQGSIGDYWRTLYAHKRTGTQVVCGIYLDWLFVTILTDLANPDAPPPTEPVTLVCNLTDRTWFRFYNLYSTCYIESESGTEEMWFGLETDNKIAQTSPLFSWDVGVPGSPAPPTVDAIDGNARSVRPLLDLGYRRLGAEGVKRVRHVYVSHQSMSINPGANPNILQVDYEVDPQMERGALISAGQVPATQRYGRHRLRIGRRGYGLHVVIRQIAPAYLSRLYDVSLDEWAQDRGKL